MKKQRACHGQICVCLSRGRRSLCSHAREDGGDRRARTAGEGEKGAQHALAYVLLVC